MQINNGYGWTFDTAAGVYDKIRPGYVPELYDAIFACCPINDASHALEIGIGTGQATLPILKTGCQLTAVEMGENLARTCLEKFQDFPNFSVITGKFEDVSLEPGTFDLIFAATSFHWIPEEIGYRKVFSLLKPGGVFARFANRPHPAKDDPQLREEINELYAKYHYGGVKRDPRFFDEAQGWEIAQIPEKYGFSDIQCHFFHRVRVLTALEYVSLLSTYSDNLALPDPTRAAFFKEIAEAIHRHGGTISIFDTLDLELARKA